MKKILALVSMTLATTLAWATPGSDGSPFKGKVLETADGGTYIYLKLQTADGPVWAATTKQVIPTGADVVIHDPMLMTNFQSKTLNRTFDEIVFASAVSVEGSQAAGPTKAQMTAAHKGTATASATVPVTKVAKAAGPSGRTVAEVYAQKSQLSGKTVDVRGTVVKFNAGIMDRNWIHLRDGSGSAGNASDDLLVTTLQTAKVGDVIVASGPVRTNVDYGSGYAYPVLIEGAALKK
jgi:hypothetical protein